MIRCHDNQCRVRERCERWRQRNGAPIGTQHALTLKAAWIPHSERCERYERARGTDALLESGPAGWLVVAWLMGLAPSAVHLQRLSNSETRISE